MDYQHEYIIKNPSLHSSDTDMKVDAILKMARRIDRPKTILDVACGSGKILIKIVDALSPQSATGIDISRVIVAKANQLNTDKRISFIVSDVFSYQGNYVELVLAIDIIEHIEEDLKLLEFLGDTGKYVIAKIPIEKNLVNTILRYLSFGHIDYWRETERKYGHLHHYSLSELRSRLDTANLNVLCEEFIPLPKRSVWWREYLRWFFYPLWLLSRKSYIRTTGGFVILLLEKKNRDRIQR